MFNTCGTLNTYFSSVSEPYTNEISLHIQILSISRNVLILFYVFSVFTFSGCKSTQKLLYYNPLRQHGFFFLETSCFSFLIDFLIITKRIEIILGFIYAWAFMLISIKLIVLWIIWKLNSKLITNYEISHYISIVSLNVRAYRDIFFV